MDEQHWLGERFQAQRPRLRAVAYRMLGSLSEAEDAVQEAWLRLSRADRGQIDDLAAWLTTVVARIALNMLRSRRMRGETRAPDAIVDADDGTGLENGALLADGVGLALLVVLETLAPAERVAFVLHDVFGLPFQEIGPMVQRTPAAARQLASRARRRLGARKLAPDADLRAQRRLVDAFAAAAQEGDYRRLVAILDPDVRLRADVSTTEVRGAEQVARQAQSFSHLGVLRRPVLINGAAGLLCLLDGKLFSLMAFTVSEGRIAAIDLVRDPERLARIDLSVLDV